MRAPVATTTVLLLLLVAGASSITGARSKPFWYDDVVTVDVASLPSLSAQWNALAVGVDSQPFGYYLIQRVANMVPLGPHLTYRLPSICAYLLAIGAAFLFLERRFGSATALLAATLVGLSPLRSGAEAARSYVLLAGFVGVAAAIWRRLGRSVWMATALSLTLAVAVASHHLGVVAVGCFGVAELVENAIARRVRWPAWTALVVATLPFLIGLPMLLQLRTVFGQHFWSRSTLRQIPETYNELASTSGRVVVWLAVMMIVAALASRLLASRGTSPVTDVDSAPAPSDVPDLVLIGMIALYPVWLVVPTWLAGSAYVSRYAEPAIFGLATSAAVLVRRACKPWAMTAFCGGCLVVFLARELPPALRVFRAAGPTITLADRLPTRFPASVSDADLPIVVADGLDYLPLVHYAASVQARRYVHLVDPETAVRLIGTDTLDRTNLLVSTIVPLQVERLQTFLEIHPRFFVYASRSEFCWLPRYLLEAHYRLVVLSDDGGSVAYRVERP